MKMMNLRSWYKTRGLKFIWQRGLRLFTRYSAGAGKVVNHINQSVLILGKFGCAPTFFIPGFLVERYPDYILQLQQMGAEIAVHSYHHVNLSSLPLSQALRQLTRATQAIERLGIKAYGYRCPYLDHQGELLDSLPSGLFEYSSNQAINWNVLYPQEMSTRQGFFEVLDKLYKGKDASKNVCVPSLHSDIVEIPVCIPDDLQLYDGLHLDAEAITTTWKRFLSLTHQRGELFTLIFHTELAPVHASAFSELLKSAQVLQPAVWVSRLKDISDWWREKSAFGVDIIPETDRAHLTFHCSARATILARGLDIPGSWVKWDGNYVSLQAKHLVVPATPRPLVGLADGIPSHIVTFLKEQGYILDAGKTAAACGIYLDPGTLARLSDELQLVNYIESSTAPLVRYWRWPDGARSALSITGDMDALSLVDYGSRLFT